MTCTHVLGLIDAGPFADYPRATSTPPGGMRVSAPRADRRWNGQRADDDLPALRRNRRRPRSWPRASSRASRRWSGPPHSAAGAMPEEVSTRDRSAWAFALGGLAAGLAVTLSLPPGDQVNPHRVPQHQRDNRRSRRDVLDDHRGPRPRGRPRALRRRPVRAARRHAPSG